MDEPTSSLSQPMSCYHLAPRDTPTILTAPRLDNTLFHTYPNLHPDWVVLQQGYLEKLPIYPLYPQWLYLFPWRVRYFVLGQLHERLILQYYVDESKQVRKGSIYLHGYKVEAIHQQDGYSVSCLSKPIHIRSRPSHEDGDGMNEGLNYFNWGVRGRVILRCHNEEEMSQWIRRLVSVL
jgi:hypothetical protein